VWTGTEIVIFGGGTTAALATGARYNPSLDVWTTIAAASVARKNHVTAWTGSELIVFGGWNTPGVLGGGEAYDPVGNSWRMLPNDPHAPMPREGAAGVWTGNELIVWGGSGSNPVDSGAIYVP
jgi:N-acetylneuraminic acid mutarotase